MIIKTTSEADKLVNENPNFSWDGWNIVYKVQDDYAEYQLFGVFNREDGKWYRKIVFPCNEDGWIIPDSALS